MKGVGRVAFFVRIVKIAGEDGRKRGKKLKISRANLETHTKVKCNWNYPN